MLIKGDWEIGDSLTMPTLNRYSKEKGNKVKKKKIWERVVPIFKADRSWDIEFWQSQSPSSRFNAAFGMLEDFYKMRGKRINANTFRLQRSVENIKQA